MREPLQEIVLDAAQRRISAAQRRISSQHVFVLELKK